ncbi:MAG TPA: hypothetical protein VHV57_07995 [Acidimicrobiales bacterium]|jgi:hypothetical protein|nr:hypothetical protein [Acidimicrobiales bacterium]
MWFTRRAITLHVVIAIVVPTFAALCFWQIHRALDGNSLSWAYVFEWPFFAGYAVYMWWRFVHEVPPGQTQPPKMAAAAAPPTGAEAADEADRAAYNDYLASLADHGKRKDWR